MAAAISATAIAHYLRQVERDISDVVAEENVPIVRKGPFVDESSVDAQRQQLLDPRATTTPEGPEGAHLVQPRANQAS